MAAGMKPLDAATLGALAHGVSGATLSAGNPNGMLAREIADGIRNALY
jgi:NAD(P)H-hydrate repair Nnr-like enzyme with NAD(P)H-hydrate dehydratase domain